MKNEKLHAVGLRSTCRRCINEQYGVELKNGDCYYLPYPEECVRCGQVRNIVADVRGLWRWRLKRAANRTEQNEKRVHIQEGNR